MFQSFYQLWKVISCTTDDNLYIFYDLLAEAGF